MIINRPTFTCECHCAVSFSKLENNLSQHVNILNNFKSRFKILHFIYLQNLLYEIMC